MKAFSYILLFFYALTAMAQVNEGPLLPKQQLLEDLSILQNNLEKAQPSLYTYTPREEMDAFFAELREKLTKDMSSIDFFRLLAPLSNKIRNGHTILVPSSKWEDRVVSEFPLLPLDLYFKSDTLYVHRNLSDNTQTTEGAVVHSINGKSAIEVFNYMVERWFKDGYNLTRPREIVSDEYKYLYTHFYGPTTSFELLITTPEGEEKTVQLKGLTEELQRKRLQDRYNYKRVPWWQRGAPPLSLEFLQNTAILKITLFSNGVKGTNGMKYQSFVRWAFEEIKKKGVEHLILDLRGNQGGDVKPQLALLSHLINNNFKLYKNVHAITRKLPNPEYYEFSVFNRSSFKKSFESELQNGVYPMKKK